MPRPPRAQPATTPSRPVQDVPFDEPTRRLPEKTGCEQRLRATPVETRPPALSTSGPGSVGTGMQAIAPAVVGDPRDVV